MTTSQQQDPFTPPFSFVPSSLPSFVNSSNYLITSNSSSSINSSNDLMPSSNSNDLNNLVLSPCDMLDCNPLLYDNQWPFIDIDPESIFPADTSASIMPMEEAMESLYPTSMTAGSVPSEWNTTLNKPALEYSALERVDLRPSILPIIPEGLIPPINLEAPLSTHSFELINSLKRLNEPTLTLATPKSQNSTVSPQDIFAVDIPQLYSFDGHPGLLQRPDDDFGCMSNFLENDKAHERAEDALKERMDARAGLSPLVRRGWLSSSPLKRSLAEREGCSTKMETVQSISSLCRDPRKIAPILHGVISTPASRAAASSPYPHLRQLYKISPLSSRESSPDPERDYFDDDFVPTDRRTKKKPRRQTTLRRGKKTQLQTVLEDMPFTLDDIECRDGFFYCPFEGCTHTATSEGDLGRHLESSSHATHRYVCLAPDCLVDFAREDSMKRHHSNNRGGRHKYAHDYTLHHGFPRRVKIEELSKLKQDVIEWDRSQRFQSV